MKRGRKPKITNLPRAVDEACRAIIAKGKRPTMRGVRAWLVKRDGTAPNFTEIAPLVRDWKSARRDSKAVDAVCRAYNALDAEQRKAVRDTLRLIRQA